MAEDFCINHGWVDSHSWKINKFGKLCHRCSKPRALDEGFLTQTAPRIREDREKCAKELVQPFIGADPNPEFVKAYPDKAPYYYDQKELKKMDAEKMKSRRHEEFKKPK